MLDIATILGAIGVSDALSECRESPEVMVAMIERLLRYQARGNIFNLDAEEESTISQEDASCGSSLMPAAISSSKGFKRVQDLCAEMGTRVSKAFEAVPMPVVDLTVPIEIAQEKASKGN